MGMVRGQNSRILCLGELLGEKEGDENVQLATHTAGGCWEVLVSAWFVMDGGVGRDVGRRDSRDS